MKPPKKPKFHLKKTDLKSITNYFTANYDRYQLKITNYTMQIETDESKYLFSDGKMNKSVFIYYNMIKKDNAGEVREVPKDFRYYDFSGLENIQKEDSFFCIDLNSAYLSVLLRDKIITKDIFDKIHKRAAKKHRLQSVGMFAKNPVLIDIEKGVPTGYKMETDAFKWIFYHAVREVYLAMNKVKESDINNFLFYWVDGVFVKGKPEEVQKIFSELGFMSKIEPVKNFKKTDKSLVFDKYSNTKGIFEKKILFLPRSNKAEKKDIISQLKRAIKI